ncbi:MAG: hypothetical protein C0467_03955 [Planctomycetaceae bacterium]|nr:hypothetical protein [Planctomycetaceae bacterium]
MATASLDLTLRKVVDGVRDSSRHPDAELLSRYRNLRDQEAFGSLVRRHGPMVLGVCRRVLRDAHAADDAFQATFLVLAKKANEVRPPDRLAPWLHGVAYRTALKSRGRASRRQQVESDYAAEFTRRSKTDHLEVTDLLSVIDEQLSSLPEKYRTPLVLCGVQGMNKTEAAERIGVPEGTVSSRLARAREMLRERLARRGMIAPAATIAALFTAETLQASVPLALTSSTVGIALESSDIPATVLTLSHEVLRSMTLAKLNFLSAIAVSVSLVGGGFGLLAIQAEDTKSKPVPANVKKEQPVPGDPVKKPQAADPVKKPNGDGQQNQSNDGQKNQKDGEKPSKPTPKVAGRVAAVDAKENTITVAMKGEGGVNEKVVKLASGAKVFVDGKEAKLADVPKGSIAAFVLTGTKDGAPAEITEVRVTGTTVVGVIKQVDTASISLESEKNPQNFKLAPGAKVTVNGKEGKASDLKAGEKVAITLSSDGNSALSVTGGIKGDGEKPTKMGKFSGKVAAVDASARTISLAAKGEAGNEIVVKLTADAKITVDGKDAKISNITKGVIATFTLVAAKDGQPREASEVVVAGITFGGTIKQLDPTSVTIGNEKSDRVVKLVAGGKVIVGGKDAKLADLKVGDKVMVTLTSDESGAVLIVVGGKKPEGDKPKPEKGNPEGEE